MKRLLSLLMAALLLLPTGCTAETADTGSTLACTTYPVYLLAEAVTEGSGIEPVLVIDQQISCLHNYTLTIRDMKLIESSTLLAINGGGLEDFLDDVLESRDYLDCSAGITLLEEGHDHEEGEESHGHGHESDPHIWLDPARAGQMAQNLAAGLGEADPENAALYQANADAATEALTDLQAELKEQLAPLTCRELITFHDGFGYFAQALDLKIAAAVEEEEGSEASARRIRELVELVDEYQLPAVFTEQNGSIAAASALAMERPIQVCALTLGMSRDSVPEELSGLDAYEWILRQNVNTILEAYQ